MDTILVTGATGFIGGRIVARLLERGESVRVLVRDRRRVGLPEGVERFEADLCDPSTLNGVERDVDRVVHAAALLGKWGTAEEEIRRVNVGGTENLLGRFRGRSLGRFLHLSAGGVTGPLHGRVADESTRCRPATAYERTKWTAERRALELGRKWEIPVSVVRPTYTYGPGDPHKLPLFRAVKRGRFAFIGDGSTVNHPCFIDDLVRGIELGLDQARSGEVYIVGGERPVTKRELVWAIADALGVKRPRLMVPRAIAWPAASILEAVGRLTGFEPILTRSRVMMMDDDFGYSIAKARAELGYAPQVDLAEGIRRTVEAYRRERML